jgi:hypothetical protein
MNTYLVAYDGRGVEEDYTGLVVQIADFFGGSVQILPSVWLLHSGHSAEDILRVLKPHMIVKGGLLVLRLHGGAAFTGFEKDMLQHLRRFL